MVKKCPLVGSALSALILEDEVRLRVPVDLSLENTYKMEYIKQQKYKEMPFHLALW